VPLVLVVPTVALAAVALATWRLNRRLGHDAARLDGAASRLASIRDAVAALDAAVGEAHLRRDALARQVRANPDG
jgi:hypothetical protein